MTPGSMSVSLVFLASQLKHQCIHNPGNSLSRFLMSIIKANLLEHRTSHKALMIFYNDAGNSHVPAFLEFLVGKYSLNNKP